MTGARLVVNERDKDLFETGGKADFRFGNDPSAMFEAVKVDGTFKDGESISLGGVTLVAHLSAGHTKGATSFTTTVTENGKTYRVGIMNMGSINPGVKMSGMPGYATISQDYARTFLAQKDTQLDVFLASHASQFKLHEKVKAAPAYSPDRFVDPKGYLTEVQRLEKLYLEQVAKEKAGK
jgi:metallo-beta-lactamase class B